jgi:hypothetical protein
MAPTASWMRARGLIESSGWLTDAGRETKERIESLTDDLAAPPYDALKPSELDQLIADSSPSPQRSTLPARGRTSARS